MSADPEARIIAEMRERAIKSYHLDLSKARKEGRADGLKEGIQEGRTSFLTNLISSRFGALSPAVAERIERATEKQLLEWGKRLLTADTLDAVFGES